MSALMVSPESTLRCVVECSPALVVSRCCSKVVVRRDDFLRIWARCFSLASGVAAFRARIVSDFARRAVPTFRATPYHEGSIVPESALGAPHGCCPACGATSRRTRVGVLQREPIVELLRCGVCGASAASRFPTEEWLMAWYARYYGDHKTGVTFTGFERFAAHIEPHVQVPLSAPLRILDFGSGDGALAIAIAKRWLDRVGGRAEIVLVDYHPAAICDDPRIQISPTRSLDDVHVLSSLVLASAILEHVPDPEETLRRLTACLAPAGLFYARTPWMESFVRWIPGFDAGYPGHLYDLGPMWWNSVGARLQLSVATELSQPSIVETGLGQAPARTLAAWILKAPGHVEARLRAESQGTRLWGWVGGWEVFWRQRDL